MNDAGMLWRWWWRPRGAGQPFVPPTLTVPSAPLNLRAVAGDGQVVLFWEPPANTGGTVLTRYQRRRTRDNNNFQNWQTVPGGLVLTVTLGGLTNGVAYRFRVRCSNSEGNSPDSNTVSETPEPAVLRAFSSAFSRAFG